MNKGSYQLKYHAQGNEPINRFFSTINRLFNDSEYDLKKKFTELTHYLVTKTQNNPSDFNFDMEHNKEEGVLVFHCDNRPTHNLVKEYVNNIFNNFMLTKGIILTETYENHSSSFALNNFGLLSLN